MIGIKVLTIIGKYITPSKTKVYNYYINYTLIQREKNLSGGELQITFKYLSKSCFTFDYKFSFYNNMLCLYLHNKRL